MQGVCHKCMGVLKQTANFIKLVPYSTPSKGPKSPVNVRILPYRVKLTAVRFKSRKKRKVGSASLTCVKLNDGHKTSKG